MKSEEGKQKMAAVTKKQPKVGELATLIGVSASTVSKVINGRPGVSDETRRKVESLLEENGYSRSLVSTKTSQTIELVVEYVENNGTIEFIKNASSWALQHGIGITVSQTDLGKRREECFRGIIERNPLGVVVQMSSISAKAKELLRARNIPYVIIDPTNTVEDDDMSVSVDNWTGEFLAVQHLIDLGHRNIGIITGQIDTQSAIARYAGYVAALGKNGITLNPALVKHSDYRSELGYKAARALLNLPEPPTAIVAPNDLIAVTVYHAARELGLALPTQLSVVGFDDVYPAQDLYPSLTTVNQPFDLVVTKALDMIMAVQQGQEVEKHVIFPTQLIVRESTVAPANALNTAKGK
jgi:LacI family transcriptional regulator